VLTWNNVAKVGNAIEAFARRMCSGSKKYSVKIVMYGDNIAELDLCENTLHALVKDNYPKVIQSPLEDFLHTNVRTRCWFSVFWTSDFGRFVKFLILSL